MADNKSILDGVPVKDKAFPLKGSLGPQEEQAPLLPHVGNCPKCGAPIYGASSVRLGAGAVVQRSCLCQNERVEGTMRTT